jgi:uncharacterized membrane protein (DUF4010 family)
MLMASGTMYLRILVLVALFNRTLAARLLGPFLVVGIGGLIFGWYWTRVSLSDRQRSQESLQIKNPLELSAAFFFALMFVALLAASHYVLAHFGRGGIYTLAGISGIVDVDPFVLGMTQSAQPVALAAAAIAIAASSNNVMKGLYALGFGDRRTGLQALGLLSALAVAGLAPVFLS